MVSGSTVKIESPLFRPKPLGDPPGVARIRAGTGHPIHFPARCQDEHAKITLETGWGECYKATLMKKHCCLGANPLKAPPPLQGLLLRNLKGEGFMNLYSPFLTPREASRRWGKSVCSLDEIPAYLQH